MSAFSEPLARLREPLAARLRQLQPRERWMVGAAAAVLLGTLVYVGVWEPVVKAETRRQQALVNARATAVRLEEAALLVQRSRSQGGGGAGRTLSLLAAVDQSIKQAALGKAPSRIQPEGEREVRVWFEGVAFDGLPAWLADLQNRYGVRVLTAEVERQDAAGLVDARLSLGR